MKRRSHIPFLFWILLAACALPLMYAVYKGREEFALLGLLPAIFLVIALIVFKIRHRQFQKILHRESHLLYFEYNTIETAEIIERELPKLKKAANLMALHFVVCLLIIFMPFALMMLKSNPSSPIWAVFSSTVLIPVLGAIAAPRAAAGKIQKSPCITAVGPDHILIANRYPGINDYGKLKLEYADFLQTEQGAMPWLRLRYSYVAMKNATRIQKIVDVPVPRNKTAEAESFVQQFVKQGKAHSIKH